MFVDEDGEKVEEEVLEEGEEEEVESDVVRELSTLSVVGNVKKIISII